MLVKALETNLSIFKDNMRVIVSNSIEQVFQFELGFDKLKKFVNEKTDQVNIDEIKEVEESVSISNNLSKISDSELKIDNGYVVSSFEADETHEMIKTVSVSAYKEGGSIKSKDNDKPYNIIKSSSREKKIQDFLKESNKRIHETKLNRTEDSKSDSDKDNDIIIPKRIKSLKKELMDKSFDLNLEFEEYNRNSIVDISPINIPETPKGKFNVKNSTNMIKKKRVKSFLHVYNRSNKSNLIKNQKKGQKKAVTDRKKKRKTIACDIKLNKQSQTLINKKAKDYHKKQFNHAQRKGNPIFKSYLENNVIKQTIRNGSIEKINKISSKKETKRLVDKDKLKMIEKRPKSVFR